MNSDQALSLQSALFKIATAAGGNWAPSRAAIGDVAISALATIADAGTLIAELTICDREFLAYSKTASFAGLAGESATFGGAAATFRVGAVAQLADLEFDTIRAAFERLRAEVHAGQVAALSQIEAARLAEASAALH